MSLDDRKDAFEKKYAHDQELMFRVEARTCKLFGLWVAGEIGLNGEIRPGGKAAVRSVV